MRNRLRSFVTKSGRVVRAVVGENESQVEPEAKPESPGQEPASGNVYAPRPTAFMVLAMVCVFILILAAIGMYSIGKWVFSGKDNTPAAVQAEQSPRDAEVAEFRRPAFERTVSRPSIQSKPEKEAVEAPVTEPRQTEAAVPTSRQRRQEQSAPVVSMEPSVDYQSSVKRMRSVLESQSAAMKKMAAELDKLKGVDSSDR